MIILAAGAGKRMKSALPKVLQPLAGKPLLQYVLDTARSLNPAAIHVVYGHGGAAVPAAFAHEAVSWVQQAEQLGTGHAVMQVAPLLSAEQRVLILYGDGPLITRESLQALLLAAGRDEVGLLTVKASDPSGYGRVLRAASGRVQAIVEDKDATAKQRRVDECNTGVLTAPAGRLLKWLGRLNNRNSQREYYLTDVIALAVRDRVTVRPVVAADEREVQGINDRVQLAAAENAWRLRQARKLMLEGATLIDPARVDVRSVVSVGQDVVIDVNVVFEGDVKLGDGVKNRSQLPDPPRADCGRYGGVRELHHRPREASDRIAGSVRLRGCGRSQNSPNGCTSATSSRSRRRASVSDPRPTISPTWVMRRSVRESMSVPVR